MVQVAKASVKEQIFDVGYLSAVKSKLKVLLSSEITPISEMSHDGEEKERSIESEGRVCVIMFKKKNHCNTILFLQQSVTCNVGDWVEVMSDYSPGQCSEGGTGVIVAKNEGLKLVRLDKRNNS
jgi:hypothetical protein